MARPRPSLPVLVLAAVALVAGTLIAVAVLKERGIPTGSSADNAKNEKIIDRLEPYPGARETRRFLRESYGEYGEGLLPGQADQSHSTTIVYSMPANTGPKQVADFYGRQLPGWGSEQGFEVTFPCGETSAPEPCFASFTKGEAVVSISFDRRRKTFFLAVDARGNSTFAPGSD